jgi:hypothetical protein
MNEQQAKEFAEEKFKKLSMDYQKWNYIHSKCMIKAIDELTDNKGIIEKLKPLAWVHDIGKINGDNHAEKSIEVLKDFNLDETEKDCILNHGSSGNPKSEEAKIFQCADGISLFYPETVIFKFWADAKEGKSFEEIKEDAKRQYIKYLKTYSSEKAINLLKKKFKALFI